MGLSEKIECRSGFWLGILGVDPEPADQTFESHGERARFYAAEAPDGLLEWARAEPGLKGPNPLREDFDGALADAVAASRSPKRMISAKLARWRADSGEWLLSCMLVENGEGSAPSIMILYDWTLGLPSMAATWKAGESARATARAFLSDLSESFFDRVEKRLGLPERSFDCQRDQSRIHWGDDWPPSCQALSAAAAAAAEAAAIDTSARVPARIELQTKKNL